MSEHVLTQPQRTDTPQETTRDALSSLKHRCTNQAESTTLPRLLSAGAHGTFASPRLSYDFSRVPTQRGMVQRTQPLFHTKTMVQRYPLNANSDSATTEMVGEPAPPVSETSSTPATTGPEEESATVEGTTALVLLVEDSATELATGQMRKSEFLTQLRSEVNLAAEAALTGTDRTAADCPYLEYWFGYYSRQDSSHIERAIHRYAPETGSVISARGYIPIIVGRVRRSVETWARTGEITGVPEVMPMGVPGMGLLGGIGRVISGIGSIFFKPRDGGAKAANDPQAIQKALGAGYPLNSDVRSRMESAFGMDFSHVRAHTDITAARLSNHFNARAFTVGEHIAFGAGEYRPGTLAGDALMAHELAHVVQQNGRNNTEASRQSPNARYNALEEDADASAAGILVSLGRYVKRFPKGITRNALPRLRSGLQLQRCATGRSHMRLQPQTLTDFARMTPWQLSRVQDQEFTRDRSGDQTTRGPRFEDYARASRLARAVFHRYNVTFDIDASRAQVGREPNEEELRILDSNLAQILDSGEGTIRRFVAGPGGRGIPTHGASRAPTLRGRFRIARTDGEFAAKRYQLEMLVSSGLRDNTGLLDAQVAGLWDQFRIQRGSSPRITEQERRLVIFVQFLGGAAAGFYHPPDDTIYLPPNVDLNNPEVNEVAHHETIHLLGGGERTRQAFVRRFGTNYLRYWFPFEEGIAQLLTQETRPAGQRAPSMAISTSRSTTPVTVEGEGSASQPPRSSTSTVTVEVGGSQYEDYVRWIRRLFAMSSRNRELLMRAYFTGNVPESVFQLIIRVPPPPV